MVQWMKTISQYTAGKEEFDRLMAEEEAERQLMLALLFSGNVCLFVCLMLVFCQNVNIERPFLQS